MSKGDLQAVAQRAIEGREAAGAPRTQGKAESAGAEHRADKGGTVRRCGTTMLN